MNDRMANLFIAACGPVEGKVGAFAIGQSFQVESEAVERLVRVFPAR